MTQRPALVLRSAHRLLAVMLLGFASGLPLSLTGQALQAWLSTDGIDLVTIGFLSLVGVPYTFKFLWAPLADRFDTRGPLRRRSWMMATQLALALALWSLSGVSPHQHMALLATLALAVAFLSATQDIAVDAYRTELLQPHERGLGASLTVMGYRVAMIVSGGLAFIWTDTLRGGAMTWPEVYRLMALLMVGAAVLSLVLMPRLDRNPGTAEGPVVPDGVLVGASSGAVLGASIGSTFLSRLLSGLGLSTLKDGLRSFFRQPGAWALLALIVLYKLGDAFAGSLMTPFLLKGVGFSSAEVGVVNKVMGLWLTIAGAMLGGAFMLRLGLWRSLMAFGLLQAASNLGFWWLAVHGREQLGALVVPAFDWTIVKLAQATPVDGGLLLVIASENLSGGMGTAAFVALLMGLCRQGYAATHFALLSALAAVGRVWVGPAAGLLVESIGWPVFFVASTAAALPGLWMLWRLRAVVQSLDMPPPA